MEFVIEFYKELDMLNLIIFWGIIIVIILLLIFSMIMINKNKKLKKMIEKQKETEEELPIIKQEEITIENNIQEKTNEIEEIIVEPEEKSLPEDIVEYRNNLFELSNENKDIDLTKENKIEIPNAPYQRNVLREMSLSQTSPIGINREINNNKMEFVKDLDESLNEENIEKTLSNEEEISRTINNNLADNKYNIKEEITTIKEIEKYNSNNDDNQMLNEKTIKTSYKKQNINNEYLEEVSRKLAEAEIPDEIERTNYELKQEEDAIISYKELMEKKDIIQTIDEEEAIISIEELMNKKNKENESKEEISKLYNLSEEEENENFIKELKQFRNDL